MSCSHQVVTEHPLGVLSLLQEFLIAEVGKVTRFFPSEYASPHSGSVLATNGRIHTAIVLNRVGSPGVVSGFGFKGRLSFFVGNKY